MSAVAVRHDARIWLQISPRPKRPYGWSCPCGKSQSGYATGESAQKAATTHNGGIYR